jgi:hydrogenase maturation protein HypF
MDSINVAHPSNITRIHIFLTGILQGIGCRPTIYRQAAGLGLVGFVRNTSDGVHIEIEGNPQACEHFISRLYHIVPFPGKINSLSSTEIPVLGENNFVIQTSLHGTRSATPIPPDVSVCRECLSELFDPNNPRYLYPFITCTLCGPRFTVVRGFPYDRERTSMADFQMCKRCSEEYAAPLNRRFHSQTNSCGECGPRLFMLDSKGAVVGGDPILHAVELIRSGKILAIKGIGGFHLACDATNENAVGLLRKRKARHEKPFAVMMRDIEEVMKYCEIDDIEHRILNSAVSPITLLRSSGIKPASNVASGMGTLGVMLPYSPVHHLLFKHPVIDSGDRLSCIVMTSGNLSEEPIVRSNEEAIEKLGHIADAILMNNRDIVLRADDSIVRVIAGRAVVFRRSRGLVPGEFSLHDSIGIKKNFSPPLSDNRLSSGKEHESFSRVVLAAGGDVKNALAIATRDGRVVPGPHVGDLESLPAQEHFQASAKMLSDYLEADPEVVAIDPHPEYFSSRISMNFGTSVEKVFHHHAHAVSLLVEHGEPGPGLFVVFDGTGYGPDGSIWGGEFIICDRVGFNRVGRLGLFALPGGQAAIREPVRIMASLLSSDGALPQEYEVFFGDDLKMVSVWLSLIGKKFNSPMTSSAGRLFDAAAALCGFRRPVNFEGQAAMWLETIADPEEKECYRVNFESNAPLVIDVKSFMTQCAEDLADSVPASIAAARFHNTLSEAVAISCERLLKESGLKIVGLTGGCFQNKLFTERTLEKLLERDIKALVHENIPPNDGGLAIGQATVAQERMLRRRAFDS